MTNKEQTQKKKKKEIKMLKQQKIIELDIQEVFEIIEKEEVVHKLSSLYKTKLEKKSGEKIISKLINLDKRKQLNKLSCPFINLLTLNLKENTNLTYLDCSNNKIKDLNLKENTNLTYLDCSNNKIKDLNLKENTNLKIVNVAGNKIQSNLKIFSYLVKLEELTLEANRPDWETKTHNCFRGSLDCLENCQNLRSLQIGYQPDINTGLSHLPTEKLENFSCHNPRWKNIKNVSDLKEYIAKNKSRSDIWKEIDELNEEKQKIEDTVGKLNNVVGEGVIKFVRSMLIDDLKKDLNLNQNQSPVPSQQNTWLKIWPPVCFIFSAFFLIYGLYFYFVNKKIKKEIELEKALQT
jgi:hypothetical protein